MCNKCPFTQSQLEVIQAMQERVDRAVEEFELPPKSQPSPKEVHDALSYDWHKLDQCDYLQCKLIADSHDHKIPRWAVPDVRAAWLARRNRLGKGSYCMCPNCCSMIR